MVTYRATNLISGTYAQRIAMATGSLQLNARFFETDTQDLWAWTGSEWSLVASNTASEILQNKTINTPVINTAQIGDSNATNKYIFGVSALAADRTVSLPQLTSNDTFTMNGFTAILTNKTLDADNNTLSNITNSSIKANAAIADTKLGTISTSNKVSGSAVQLASTTAIENSTGLRLKSAVAGDGLTLSSQALAVNVDDSSVETSGGNLRVKAAGVTNTMLAGSIAVGKLGSTETLFSIATNPTMALYPGGTLTVDGTTNEVTVSGSGGEGDATIVIGLPNNVTIGGNLTVTGNHIVNGTTTTVNSTVVTVDDPVFTLGGDTAPSSDDNKDRGIEFRYYDGSAKIGFFGYDDSTGVFTGFTTATNSSEVFSGTVMNATFGNIAGTLTTAAQANITSVGTLASITVTGAGVFNGNVDLGNATSDTITATGRFDSDLVPSTDGARDLGTSGLEWQDLFIDGTANIDTLTADAGTVGGSDIVTLAATQTLTSKTLTTPAITAPTITGGTAIELTNLSIRDESVAYDLVIQSNDAQMSADRSLIFDVNNVDRTIALNGNVTLAHALTTAGSYALTLTQTGTTNVTLPTTGTIATVGGTETLTGKTLTSPVLTTPQINDSDASHQYIFAVGNLTADRTVTLPLLTGNDTFTFNAFAATLTNKTMSGANNTFSAIPTSALTGTAFIVTDGSTASNIASGGTLTFAATANETTVAQSGGTVTVGLPNDVVIAGNLTVNGTTTTVNSTVTTVDDPVLTLGGDTAPSSDDDKDRGIEFRYHTGSAAAVGFFGYDDSAGVFTGFTGATNSSEVFSGTVMNAVFGDVTSTTQSANDSTTKVATTAYVQAELTAYASDSVAFTNKTLSGEQITSGTVADARIATTLSRIAGTETLPNKTLTAPKIVSGGFIADANGNEEVIFTTTSSAVNEMTVANAATGNNPSITASGETNVGLTLSGKGTGGITLTNATANGAYLEFDTKASPADPGAEAARMYLKQVDTNNNAMAVKLQKAGAIVEVEITSPRAVCAECGSRDGAKDPLYDFERGVMVLDLWCGHSFEVPMQWSPVNGNN